MRRHGLSAVALLLLAVLVCAGCWTTPSGARRPEPSRKVAFVFKNVRRVNGFDEWTHLSMILGRHALKDSEPAATSRTVKEGDGWSVKDYTAEVELPNYGKIDDVNMDIREIGQRDFDGETIEFVETAAETNRITYRTNWVFAGVQITVSGRTDPDAKVTLITAEGGNATTDTVSVDSSGQWSRHVNIPEGHRYVYGYSKSSKPEIVKCFRIDITSGRHEAITSRTFKGETGLDPEAR